MNVTNRLRIAYLLDVLAEPFPDAAKTHACNCGIDESRKESNVESVKDVAPLKPNVVVPLYTTKRELIENALFDALPQSWKFNTWQESLTKMSDAQLGALLAHVDVAMVDRHLYDLDLFASQDRVTTLADIKAWDTTHAKDDFQRPF